MHILIRYELPGTTYQRCRQGDQEVDKVQSTTGKKAHAIFLELAVHPRTGTGHPEALKGGNDITYSRHITAHDRIIYDIHDDRVEVIVLEIEGHYNDK